MSGSRSAGGGTPMSGNGGRRPQEPDIAAELLDAFAAVLRGELLRPGDAGYDPARELWNGMIDRHPALVARCHGDADVVAAVHFARDHGLPLAVRGGGHGVAGQALCDGGLVADLSEMTRVEVDPEGLTVRAQGGCTLGDVDRETQRHGLATPLGVVSATGIAGLTLSGGIGWLRRKYGLSCDNLVSVQMVTAEGRLIAVDEDTHADLFWAVRGGGGNFGVATVLEYRLHPVGPQVHFCHVYYPADRARDVLRACERHVAEMPGQAAPIGVLGRIPAVGDFPPETHGQLFVAVLALFPGDPEEGERALRPLREVAEPFADLSGTMPYTDAQQVLDEDFPNGRRYYWKSVNAPELGDELIEHLVVRAAASPSPDSTIDVWFQGDAMARVGEQDTAFANRGMPYLFGIEGNWDEENDTAANVAWVRDTFSDLSSYSSGGVYLNFPGFLEEGERLLHEGYGPNLERLAAVKAAHDPGNLFHHNANIRPST
ncbi:FAD-binding oxidoreductase [Streptomyces sp. ACA25]|uniref:FAD-binding oxidoreductase n=1 Tax=Streptomyces sp. ACA25 TaxID=3022596 RepID=UPI0023082556|nr:FAD-binding oxidoreductase [Streptomyces sp. ACA25]MDB1087100.1 FAD-binding oxidoreductase [Streptomyces sp. ACA25]